MTTNTLPSIGTLIARIEAPTVRYRVTSHSSATARCLPFRTRGQDVTIAMANGVIVGGGSVWHIAGGQ